MPFTFIFRNLARPLFCQLRISKPIIYNGTLKFNSYKRNNGKNPHLLQTALFASFLGLFRKDENEKSAAEENIVNMIKYAELSKMKGENDKAEQLLHVALRSAQELNNVKAERYIVDVLANNAYDMGDFRKAEKLFKDLISQLLSEGLSADDNAIIHMSAKLANLYGLVHQDEKANEGFKFCIEQLKQKIDKGVNDHDTLALYGLSLHWFGEYKFTRELYAEALMLFEKSHQIAIKIHGPDHSQCLLLLNNMAAACNSLGKFDSAIEHLNEAIKQASCHPDENRDDLPCYYINLANVYLQQIYLNHANKELLLSNAKKFCEIGLSLAKKSRSSDAVREAETCKAAVDKVKI